MSIFYKTLSSITILISTAFVSTVYAVPPSWLPEDKPKSLYTNRIFLMEKGDNNSNSNKYKVRKYAQYSDIQNGWNKRPDIHNGWFNESKTNIELLAATGLADGSWRSIVRINNDTCFVAHKTYYAFINFKRNEDLQDYACYRDHHPGWIYRGLTHDSQGRYYVLLSKKNGTLHQWQTHISWESVRNNWAVLEGKINTKKPVGDIYRGIAYDELSNEFLVLQNRLPTTVWRLMKYENFKNMVYIKKPANNIFGVPSFSFAVNQNGHKGFIMMTRPNNITQPK